MLKQLQAYIGKKIVLELVNGKIISGTVISLDQQFVRFGTDEGIGTIPVDAVQIIWESSKRSLTEKNMKDIAEKLKDSVKAQSPPGGFAGQTGQGDIQAQIACTSFPGFTCAQQYICRPPDTCTFSFACPGSYVPGFPQGGGCPLFACGPFQFGQPCGPFQFGQPCGPFQFGQPCGPFQFGQPCGPFQFGQPCGPFQFGQPCGPFQFGQPCGPFTFSQPCVPFPFSPPCGPFQFGGSQCGVPGGFICPGQQFIGVAPGVAPGTPPGTVPLPPVSPMEFSVEKDQSKDNKKVKE